MYGGVAGHDPAFHRHRDVGRYNRADAAAGEFFLPVDACLRARAVLIVEAAGDARTENPVFNLQTWKLYRLEDGSVVHARPPVSVFASRQISASSAGTSAWAGQRFHELDEKNPKPGSGRLQRAASTDNMTSERARRRMLPMFVPSRASRIMRAGARRVRATASCVPSIARLSVERASLRIRCIDLTMLSIAKAVAWAQDILPRDSSMIWSSARCNVPLRFSMRDLSGPA